VLVSLLKAGCSGLLPYTDSMRQLLALRWKAAGELCHWVMNASVTVNPPFTV
jgi:hypothetical protein